MQIAVLKIHKCGIATSFISNTSFVDDLPVPTLDYPRVHSWNIFLPLSVVPIALEVCDRIVIVLELTWDRFGSI